MKLFLACVFAGSLITLASLAGGALTYAFVGWVEQRFPDPVDVAMDDALDLFDEPLTEEEEAGWRTAMAAWREPEAEVDR